jgi:hypothetical protein
VTEDLLGLDRDELREIIATLRAEVETVRNAYSTMLKQAEDDVTTLRAEVERKDAALTMAKAEMERLHGDCPCTVCDTIRAALTPAQETHEYTADPYRPSRCVNCGQRREHATHVQEKQNGK